VHVYGASDTCYNVKLVVTTANGCSDTLVKEVCIPAGIEVEFDYTQTCFGQTTWFVPTLVQPAGGSIAFYTWNFGDPASGIYNESKLANPQHTFSKPGTFVVSLLATDINNCSTTQYMTAIPEEHATAWSALKITPQVQPSQAGHGTLEMENPLLSMPRQAPMWIIIIPIREFTR
jgi:PKD repeat protein